MENVFSFGSPGRLPLSTFISVRVRYFISLKLSSVSLDSRRLLLADIPANHLCVQGHAVVTCPVVLKLLPLLPRKSSCSFPRSLSGLVLLAGCPSESMLTCSLYQPSFENSILAVITPAKNVGEMQAELPRSHRWWSVRTTLCLGLDTPLPSSSPTFFLELSQPYFLFSSQSHVLNHEE